MDYSYTNELKWKLPPASELNFQSDFMVQISNLVNEFVN